MNEILEKPELIKTDSGFSVLYKNKYLYSKRTPKKSILTIIDKINIEPQTIVLCISPVLGYGIKELISKLPKTSIAIEVEKDNNLHQLSLKHIDKSLLANKQFLYFKTDDEILFSNKIEKEIINKKIRKIIKIDFSGGANLYQEFYNQLYENISKFISRFWVNRLTLIQFGRNYARNIFKNYKKIITNTKTNYSFINEKSIQKPILVIGAGPSLDETINFIQENRNNFFILAVDAASGLYPNIIPDAIAILESQFWIQRAFIGLKNSNIPLLMDLTANPKISNCTNGKVAFFYTEYQDNSFFENLKRKKLLPLKLLPMGSIGLTALSLAEKLAKDNTPIFHTGLDFSWGKGFSHSKMSYQVNQIFTNANKFNNLYSSFTPISNTCECIIGKNRKPVFTSPNLKSYAETYKILFSKKNKFYDIGKIGLNINSQLIDFNEAKKIITQNNKDKEKLQPFINSYKDKYDDIFQFLKNEKEKLLELKNIFTGKKEFTNQRIKEILDSSPYLYLHFPDFEIYNNYNLEKAYLNRIRIELEYFLKILK